MAPEILVNKIRYNHQVDVWSIGIISFELLAGFAPFMAEEYYSLIRKVAKGTCKIPTSLKLSDKCLKFLNECI